MRKKLRSYQIKVETIGPVHVGSGREFSKKEYLFLPGRKVGILDMAKTWQWMKKRGLLRQFEDYMVNEKKLDLRQWLLQNRLEVEELRPCINYILDCGDTVLQRGTKTSIMENIKDPYGLPYIPGSTLKGMLRTVLLGSRLIEDNQTYERLKKDIRGALTRPAKGKGYLAQEIKRIEAEAFNCLQREKTKKTDAVNDCLSGLIVGDSMPIDLSRVILCQKLERHVEGRNKTLNLLRECIRPGTEMVFQITIDETRCPFTIEDIQKALSTFNECYNECFLSAYSDFDSLREENLFLGGGIGFVSKTIIYPAFGKKEGIQTTQKIFENTRVPKNHKHHLDTKLGVSPHILKCTKYKGQVLQMGLCRLASIEEMQ